MYLRFFFPNEIVVKICYLSMAGGGQGKTRSISRFALNSFFKPDVETKNVRGMDAVNWTRAFSSSPISIPTSWPSICSSVDAATTPPPPTLSQPQVLFHLNHLQTPSMPKKDFPWPFLSNTQPSYSCTIPLTSRWCPWTSNTPSPALISSMVAQPYRPVIG